MSKWFTFARVSYVMQAMCLLAIGSNIIALTFHAMDGIGLSAAFQVMLLLINGWSFYSIGRSRTHLAVLHMKQFLNGEKAS